MSRTGLNLGILRGRTRADAAGPDSAAQASGGLSRRQLFRIAGAVAVAAKLMPTTRAMAASSSVQFTSKPGRAAFKLDGQEYFVVDTKAFGGAPRLSVTQGQDSVRLVLSGATFPGTELPADMVCEAQLSENGSIQFSLPVGRFSVKAPLAKWLSGDAPAVSRASLDHQVCTLGDQGRLTLNGTAKAQFFPDWSLKFDGTAIAQVNGVGRQDLISDSVTITLLDASDPSLFSNAAARRTLISLGRRDRNWDLGADALAPEGWRLETTDHPFDVLHIETSLSQKGQVQKAMAAEAGADDPRLALVAASGLKATDGSAFSMPLASVRFARTFDPNGDQVALVGRFGKDPVWLHADGCSMLLGDKPGAPALELVQKAGKLTKASCTPALLGMSSPIPNAIVEPEFGSSLTTVSLTSSLLPKSITPSAVVTPLADRVPPVFRPPTVSAPGNLKVSIVRPEDLMVLSFEFVNLALQAGGDAIARLVRQTANRPAYIVVTFQPQAIGEQAIPEDAAGNPAPPAPPVGSRIAGPSRLAFKLPPDMNALPYTLESLLSWTKYDHALVPAAQPPALLLPVRQKPELLRLSYLDIQQDCNCEPLTPALIPPPRIQMPDQYTTDIEAPYRVHISPNKFAGWAHSVAPVTHDGRTELWHTRLGVRNDDGTVDELSAYYRTIRAVWSPDYSPSASPSAIVDSSPFLLSLTSSWRDQIVRLSSDYMIKNYHPRPITVDRLMLSSLGAWMNVRGFWPNFPVSLNFTVEEWRHRAVMGRETYVRVVEPGYLFPFGNKAALITVTERKFQPTPSGNMAAYLRQRKFIVVRQPEKTYPIQGQAYSGRNMPMKTITVTTLVTPALDPIQEVFPGKGEDAFWPVVLGKDFQFNVVSVDGEGQRQEFSTPMAFVKEYLATQQPYMQTLADIMATGDASRRQRDMKGQKVAFAPATKPGDTSFACLNFTFAGEVPDASVALPADQPRFFPAMSAAQVHLAHVEALTGSNAGASIKMAQAFLDNAFDTAANKTSMFAELIDTVKANFPANMSGGVATPNLDVSGLSKALGPVGGPINDLVGGNFDPKKFFSDEAKILGGILLGDIIQALGLDGSDQDDPRVPQLKMHVVYPEKNGKEDKDAVPLGVEIKFYWKPDVKNDPLDIFVVDKQDEKTSLEVRARLYKTFDGKPPEYDIEGELKHFDVDLIAPITSFLYLSFRQITFKATNGSKPKIDPKIDNIDFRGPLAFVKALEDFLGNVGGGGSPFSLDIKPTGVTAGLSVAIPDVTVGVMSLTNMVLSAQLNLPFTGDPVRLRFAFCSRENPFCLTVSIFGGGGFFGINLGLDGIELLEASFEFGGNFSLDIGVASGGVHIMAGIYYKMEKNQNGKDDCSLTGYLRLGGSVEVLGIITISVEFNMSLTYDITNDKVWGQATLTVKIEILFFSIGVDLHVERKFKGSNGDPTFADTMDRSDWESYTEAFA